jgi:DNA processing protein
VVSGLARGVDTAAHLASLETGTIAVLAGGCDVIYPSQNTDLAQNIARQGLILSEQPMQRTPQARDFPKRNRIIAGLAQAVIVVEAAGRSGSLITARDALDLGREVMAVPGHPFDARAFGCNALIRDGAVLVRNAEDVIAALPPMSFTATGSVSTAAPPAPEVSKPAASGRKETVTEKLTQLSALTQALAGVPTPPPEKRSLKETAALHQMILAGLGPSPTASDQLMRDLELTPQAFTPALTELELEGKISRIPGGLLTRRNRGDKSG